MTIAIGGQSGSFQLNVMLPVIAHNLIQSIELLSSASRVLADKAIAGFTVNEERIAELVGRNPILVTALNPVIGYEAGAKIAKTAYAEGRSLKEVALEQTDLSADELDRLLESRQAHRRRDSEVSVAQGRFPCADTPAQDPERPGLSRGVYLLACGSLPPELTGYGR